jgi:hypothetical protein
MPHTTSAKHPLLLMLLLLLVVPQPLQLLLL